MALNDPAASRTLKTGRSSIGSKPLSFHQMKGKFAVGAVRSNPDRLERIRKDALEDFKRSTVERAQSVHQMAAMFAGPTPLDKSIDTQGTPTRTRPVDSGDRVRAAQSHLKEALSVTSHRGVKVKAIADGFRGESRPENVEVFHKKHAEQEAAYRHKVHEGKETLKKTSQGTDAMYDFVLKLNLATTEGKELFMRRWAVGRMTNGESTTPREGWKFLHSLGINVDRPERQKTPPASDAYEPVSPAGPNEADDRPVPKRGRVKDTSCPPGSPRPKPAGVENVSKQEASSWEKALSRAVGALVKVDADACAPKLRTQRRRRSGSEPRRAPSRVPQAPVTCRAPRTTSFFGFEPDASRGAVSQSDHEDSDDEHDAGMLSPLSVSPANSTAGAMRSLKLWHQDGRRPQSQGFDTPQGSLDRRLSVSSKLSEGPSCPGSPAPGRGIRLSLSCASNSPGRFALSSGRMSDGCSPLTPTEQADLSAANALSAKVSWDGSEAPLGLHLPSKLLDFGGDEAGPEETGVLDVSDVRDGLDLRAHSDDIGARLASDCGSEEHFGSDLGHSPGSIDGGLEHERAGIRLESSPRNLGFTRTDTILEDSEEEANSNDSAGRAERLSLMNMIGAGSLSTSEDDDRNECESDACDLDEQQQDDVEEGDDSGAVAPKGVDVLEDSSALSHEPAAFARDKAAVQHADEGLADVARIMVSLGTDVRTSLDHADHAEDRGVKRIGSDVDEASPGTHEHSDLVIAKADDDVAKDTSAAQGRARSCLSDEEDPDKGLNTPKESRQSESDVAGEATVRETLLDLMLGVEILVQKDDDCLKCSEILSELHSDPGDKMDACAEMKDIEDEVKGEHQFEGEAWKVKDLYKKLEIAVGSDLVEIEPPLPRLEWGVHNIEVDSPMTPSRYGFVGEEDDQASSGERTPQSRNRCGTVDGDIDARASSLKSLTAVPGHVASILPALAENEESGGCVGMDTGAVVADECECECECSSGGAIEENGSGHAEPWDKASTRIMSSLSRTRINSSSDVLFAMELDKMNGVSSAGVSPALMVAASPASSYSSDVAYSEGDMNEAFDGIGTETIAPYATCFGGVTGSSLARVEYKDYMARARSMTTITEETSRASSRRISAESSSTTCTLPESIRESITSAEEVNHEASAANQSEHKLSPSGEAWLSALAIEVAVVSEEALDMPLPASPLPESGPTGAPVDVPAPSPPKEPDSPLAKEERMASLEADRDGPHVVEGRGVDGCASGGCDEAPSLLTLDMSDPYADFDALHDQEHSIPKSLEHDCKTPRDFLSFCRPRSVTVHESSDVPGDVDDVNETHLPSDSVGCVLVKNERGQSCSIS